MVKVINNYTLIQKIGEGTFGQVYRSVNSKKIGQFAVKIIPAEKFQQNSQLEQCTINQIKTLSTICPSEYIVKYQDHFQTKNNYYFVYQYCNGGNLEEKLKKEGAFSQTKALIVFRQLLEAFKILNRFNIMHRDIKPENILFSNGKVKLGDFGFCKGLKPGQHMAKTMLGSPIYMAPEVLKGQNYTMKADIWSLGVVLYQMLFGYCPYQTKSIAMLISTINLSSDLPIPQSASKVSQKTLTLLKKLLTKDYFRRISWIQLFAYKIDEDGYFIETDSTPTTPFQKSNKSYSTIKDQSDYKLKDRSSDGTTTKYYPQSTSNNRRSKIKFYSEKYMNFVSLPIQNGTEPDRKISLFNQNGTEQINQKQETKKVYYKEPPTSDHQISQLIPKGMAKRDILLKKHYQCLSILNNALSMLENKSKESLGDSYTALTKVHRKLKEITQDIKVSQTDLLDVASMVNYQIIQVDRQLIETRQELLRRKLVIPKEDKRQIKQIRVVTSKSIEEETSTPEATDFFMLCHTEES